MTEKQWLFIALGAVTVVGLVTMTDLIAQSVFPVRFEDSEPVVSFPVEGETQSGISVALAPGAGASALTVEGEVRTVDSSDAPRLWGRGRPGTTVYIQNAFPPRFCSYESVRFGLSRTAVDWGSAADACPTGFWVCTFTERPIMKCDTVRPDSTADALECDGTAIDWASDSHIGWLADSGVLATGIPATEEATATSIRPTCQSLPVWCCTE